MVGNVGSGFTRRGVLGSAAGFGMGGLLGTGLLAPGSARAQARSMASAGANSVDWSVITPLWMPSYLDGRPVATKRLQAQDAGPVLRHGDGPGQCDVYGARDVWVYESAGKLYMNYDGAGSLGWLSSLATSDDGVLWTKHGPVLQLGAPGADDSAAASYGVTYQDTPNDWHMFYLGTPKASPSPDRIPSFPYLTLKAHGTGPNGPWTKQPNVVPFRPRPGTYYAATASPGQVIRQGGEYLQFFSASMVDQSGTHRTIGIARTHDLNSPWQIDTDPLVPLAEQIENASLYFEPTNGTWFLFTNHVALDARGEYTDAVWVYWTQDLDHWDAQNKAVVLDRANCAWSPYVVGLPSVVPFGGRLALFYDARRAPDVSHMGRDIGLAWLDLPLQPPSGPSGPNVALGSRVTVSSTYPGYAAARAVDGRTSTQVGGDFGWCNNLGTALPQWLQLDLSAPHVVGRCDVYTSSGYELRDYRIQGWTANAWADLAVVTENTAAYRVHTFAPSTCQSLRVLCESGPARQPEYTRINEIEFYTA